MSQRAVVGIAILCIFLALTMCCSAYMFSKMNGPSPAPAPAPAPKAKASSQGPAVTVPKHRYVRITRDKDGDDHHMNLAEVEVFSGGTNVAQGKTVTASSLYALQFPHANLVDGNKTNFAHTNKEAVEWFQIDLGQDYEIEKVVITNRTDCCQGRLRNTKVQLSKSADMSSPKESRVITTEEGPKATITWMPKLGADLTAA